MDDLRDARNLLLVGTKTGLATFLSIIKASETYQIFGKVILFHYGGYVNELAYHKIIIIALPHYEYLGDMITEQLIYYPNVTRENYKNKGRITNLIIIEKLCLGIGILEIYPEFDRVMLCASPAMLKTPVPC
jgi:ferredoxin--NADP+ reductase